MKYLISTLICTFMASSASALTVCNIQYSGHLTSSPDSYGSFLKIGISYNDLNANPEEITKGNTVESGGAGVLIVRHNHEWSARRYAHALTGILIADGHHAHVNNCRVE